jgi:hypothetical protein
MRTLFRNGSRILFVLSLIVFVAALSFQLFVIADTPRHLLVGAGESSVPPLWIFVVQAVSSALSVGAIPFLGACIIDRTDRIIELRSEGRRP